MNQLVDKNLVRTFDDIYKLNFDDLVDLDRMAEKSAENILNALNLSKQIEFERVLFELNRGHHIILSDNENRTNILFSATETINESTLNFHKKFSNSSPCILLSPEMDQTILL